MDRQYNSEKGEFSVTNEVGQILSIELRIFCMFLLSQLVRECLTSKAILVMYIIIYEVVWEKLNEFRGGDE